MFNLTKWMDGAMDTPAMYANDNQTPRFKTDSLFDKVDWAKYNRQQWKVMKND